MLMHLEEQEHQEPQVRSHQAEEGEEEVLVQSLLPVCRAQSCLIPSWAYLIRQQPLSLQLLGKRVADSLHEANHGRVHVQLRARRQPLSLQLLGNRAADFLHEANHGRVHVQLRARRRAILVHVAMLVS